MSFTDESRIATRLTGMCDTFNVVATSIREELKRDDVDVNAVARRLAASHAAAGAVAEALLAEPL